MKSYWHTYFKDEDGTILAYTRIYAEEDTVHFGRVLVNQAHRKSGLGQKIVAQTLAAIEANAPGRPIVIGAQEYLQSFYESFWFSGNLRSIFRRWNPPLRHEKSV